MVTNEKVKQHLLFRGNGTRLGLYEGRLRVRAAGQARVDYNCSNVFRDTRPPTLFCHSVAYAAEVDEPLLWSRGLNNGKMDARDTMGSSLLLRAAAPLHLTWRNSGAIVTGETDERRRASGGEVSIWSSKASPLPSVLSSTSSV